MGGGVKETVNVIYSDPSVAYPIHNGALVKASCLIKYELDKHVFFFSFLSSLLNWLAHYWSFKLSRVNRSYRTQTEIYFR